MNEYLALIDERTGPGLTDAQVIEFGNAICTQLAAGGAGAAILNVVEPLKNQIDPNLLVDFMALSAVDILCPQHAGVFDGIIEDPG